jgi:hypothetical protein
MADSNATLQVKPDKELYVWSGDTFTPGGRVKSHDVEVKGTLAMGTNGLTVSGSLVANAGTLTTSSGVIIRSFSDGPGETLSTGNNALKNLTMSDDSLVGYWKLDDGNGGFAKNSGIGGSGGYLRNMETGADWVTTSLPSRMRSFNQSTLDFDGSNEYVDTSEVDVAPGLTYAAWIKTDTTSGDHAIISNRRTMFAYNAGNYNWWYDVDIGSRSVASNVTAGQWFHVAVTNDTAGNYVIYENGVALASGGSTTFDNGAGASEIGHYLPFGSRYWDGNIDDVRIYNRVLSRSEIQNLYNGYPHTGSGIYSLGSKLNISGSLLNYTGELRTGNAYPLTLSGNLLNLGQFTSTGTVYLRGGTNQTMSGNTVFQNLNVTSNGRTRTIFFDHSSRQSASGALVLRGTSTNPLSLRSTRSGSGANLLLDGSSGSQEIAYMNVRNNDASGGSTLVCYAIAEGCTDSGSNTNWLFTDPAVPNGRNNRGFILMFGP